MDSSASHGVHVLSVVRTLADPSSVCDAVRIGEKAQPKDGAANTTGRAFRVEG